MVNAKLGKFFKILTLAGALATGVAGAAVPGLAQPVVDPAALPAPIAGELASYADLVALADASELVIRAQIRRQIRVEAARAPGLAPGFARLYIEARTTALIAGANGVGESLVYLVDVPLTAKGKVPKLKKREVLLFANRVPGRPGTVKLVSNIGQLAYTPELEARLRPILTALIAADAPPRVEGIADALAVRGTLVGESETQVFLRTSTGAPVSLSVVRRPNQTPEWGVSWGEVIDASAQAPAPGSLRWYRLACFLPATLPSSVNLAREPEERRLAEQDYRYIMETLGPCERRLTTVG